MRRVDPSNPFVPGEASHLTTIGHEHAAPHNQIGGIIHAVEQENADESSTQRTRNPASEAHTSRGIELYYQYAELVEAVEQDIAKGTAISRSFDRLLTAAHDTLEMDEDQHHQIEEVLVAAEQCLLSGLDLSDRPRLFDHVLTAIHGILTNEVVCRPAA